MEMEMEKGHMPVRRGVSWSPGGLRKPFHATQSMHTPLMECNAAWEKTGSNKEQMSRRTNLTRSATLSEKELKEARVRSQIIAAQLTIPSDSNSRGVQLFNRRRQRVYAFTLESCGEGSEDDRAENVKNKLSSNKLTWAERSNEEKDRNLNIKNSTTYPLLSHPASVHLVSDNIEDIYKEKEMEDHVIQDRLFLPVNEEREEEEATGDEMHKELEDKVKDEIPPGSNTNDVLLIGHTVGETKINGCHTMPTPHEKFLNGCHSTSGSERPSMLTSKPSNTIINRTARPFLSPLTVASPGEVSHVMDIPPPPSYDTPPLPAFTSPQPGVFSPPPPPPSYPTPPLPLFTNQPPQTLYSSHPQMSNVMSSFSPPPPQLPVPAVSQYPPMPNYGPPIAPKPFTYVPQPGGERRPITPFKTGILEEGAAKRANKKSMFTFKEKPVVSPNPELLSLVQGADERKKHGQRPMPDPASEEELLALGAEASNFLAKEEDKVEQARAPEWASCLKSSRTQPRAEHRPEQTLINVSGKGAELFAKRQSRMDKYVVEKKSTGQIRSPSPTMSLPPSWVYPSNMPGRVKAMAKSSEITAQLSQNLKAQQASKQKPMSKAPAPAPTPEPPPMENGCSKIEMDLSRHRPYQLSSSLFILNPIKDPISTLPRGAPQSKNLMLTQSFTRQISLPNNPPSNFIVQRVSPQLPLSPTRGGEECASNPASGQPRVGSSMSAFSPDRVSSPRSGVQAPRPTFSTRNAGIAPQTSKDSASDETSRKTPTPTRTPSFTRRFNSHEGHANRTWTPKYPIFLHYYIDTPANIYSHLYMLSSLGFKMSVPNASPTASPQAPPWGSRYQSPMASDGTGGTACISRPTHTSTVTSPVSPPWDNRCKSPIINNVDSKASHRLLAKNIINAAKRKNSPSPGALSSRSLPISPVGHSFHGYDCQKSPISPLQSRALGAQSPSFTSPPPTPTHRICSPVRLYNTRSLTDSDASVESEDSGLRSPGLHSFNTCPRGWGGSLRVKRSAISTDM
ncbi:synaptopodin [Brachionichthys hirsutus]|uniref:synaptopodin n=1 Tax=Brachionichthys hirsutus TaxID=412623 RepID=UPI0036048C99